MFTSKDLEQLSERGITPERLQSQLDRFSTGFPYMRLASSARVGAGIMKLTPEEENQAIARWTRFLDDGGEAVKMVPASGAASRMFKSLFEFLDGEENAPADDSPVKALLDNINLTPFRDDLDSALRNSLGITLDAAMADGRYKDIINALIGEGGLNYGNLPKGVLPFHRYADGTVRTPIEEHLTEGAETIADKNRHVKVHFTVSPSHRQLFTDKIKTVKPALEAATGAVFDITMSEQKPSTDTVAATPDNQPMRDSDGKIVFRPGGHGALIENLNDLDATVVFLKNIDNVVPDSRRGDTIHYKKVLAGFLVETRDTIDAYLAKLNSGNYTIDDLRQMIRFMHDRLTVRNSEMKSMEDAELALYIKSKLDRPLRVCGMVKNEGEPGGGPYIAYTADGSTSPQILESNQIDHGNKEYMAMMESATHFNPVDLVCYIKDADGKKYNLPDYVDHQAGFISSKSLHGVSLKAMELPGLWNGAMSDWNTVFVEVPISTFNPVKTVNDLLRAAHQQS